MQHLAWMWIGAVMIASHRVPLTPSYISASSTLVSLCAHSRSLRALCQCTLNCLPQGHQDEVNAICWDPTGSLLASCSDDRSVKVGVHKHTCLLLTTPLDQIWSPERDDCLHTLTHKDKIYSITWAPKVAGSKSSMMLASASCDNTTKIWDGNTGACLYTLTGHTLPVYSVSFSPNALYIASGSFDNCLLIWDLKVGVCYCFQGTDSLSRLETCCKHTTVVVASSKCAGIRQAAKLLLAMLTIPLLW